VVVGNPFELRATVVDLDGVPYQTRSGNFELHGWDDATGLAVRANVQPQKLRVLARDSDEEVARELARESEWTLQVTRAGATPKTVVLECKLIIQRSGKYEITVDGVEELL